MNYSKKISPKVRLADGNAGGIFQVFEMSDWQLFQRIPENHQGGNIMNNELTSWEILNNFPNESSVQSRGMNSGKYSLKSQSKTFSRMLYEAPKTMDKFPDKISKEEKNKWNWW